MAIDGCVCKRYDLSTFTYHAGKQRLDPDWDCLTLLSMVTFLCGERVDFKN